MKCGLLRLDAGMRDWYKSCRLLPQRRAPWGCQDPGRGESDADRAV